MLDYIWAGRILIGILSAAFSGHMADVTSGAISSAREAVSTALQCWELFHFGQVL